MNEGLSYITSSVHITTTECVSKTHNLLLLLHTTLRKFLLPLTFNLFLFFSSFLFPLGSIVFFLFFCLPLWGLLCCVCSSEEAVSTSALVFFFPLSSSQLLLWFNVTTEGDVLFLVVVVWRNHRAHFVAGGLPAAGSAPDVVVLAVVLHCGESEPPTQSFENVFLFFRAA